MADLKDARSKLFRQLYARQYALEGTRRNHGRVQIRTEPCAYRHRRLGQGPRCAASQPCDML